jgi:tRNA pseudouridine38-40 synthase
MPRFAFEVEFDGRNFQGTQAQDPRWRTLQSVMDEALLALTGVPTIFRASSRLDSGVSSLALPGDCMIERDWDPVKCGLALNARLPKDVVVRRVARVADDWSARKDAASKTYRYRIVLRPVRPVLHDGAVWVREIDHPELLNECAEMIRGTLDLSGFSALRGDDTDHGDPHRRYFSAHWDSESINGSPYWNFRISGNGFLYRQVRGLVGAMLHIAQGRRPVSLFADIVASGREGPRCGNVAPAKGLLLETVSYEPEPAWKTVSSS